MKKLLIYYIFISVNFCFSQKYLERKDYTVITTEANLEEHQRAVEHNFEIIRLNWDNNRYFSFQGGLRREYFSEKSKLLIINLLKNKWTEKDVSSEVKSRVEDLLDTTLHWNDFYKDIKKKAKQDGLPVTQVWDSIIRERTKEEKEVVIKNFTVPIKVIQIAGFLKDKRFIPLLKSLLKNETNKQKIFYIKEALAVNKISPYYEEFIAYYLNRQLRGITHFYIYGQLCNRDMVDRFIEWTMTNNKLNYDSNGTPFAYEAEGGLDSGYTEFKDKQKGARLKKELDSLRLLRIKGKPLSYNYPETIEDIDKMRVIYMKYFKDYKMEDIDCHSNALYEVW